MVAAADEAQGEPYWWGWMPQTAELWAGSRGFGYLVAFFFPCVQK